MDQARVGVLSEGPGVRSDLPGLRFDRFYERYGASCRTKNTLTLPADVRGRFRFVARLLLGRLETVDKRLFSPPPSSRLPHEFIRLDPWEAGYLYALAQEARAGIVEIGRFNGGSTFLLACANANVPIWSIDVAPRDDALLRRLFSDNDVGDRVELLVGDSRRGDFPAVGEFDLLFVDGDHTRSGCLGDLERFVPRLLPRGHVLVHDCYAGMEVQQAVVEFLQATPAATVVRPPYIPSSHWHASAGSIAHFVKAGAAS